MERSWLAAARLAGGCLTLALCAFPQAYTISAKPGAVNYIEGSVTVNDQVLSGSLKSVFLNAGDVLQSADGKAEVLLTPGVFLRVGANSQIRMLKPSLVETQFAVEHGEAMLEVDQYVHDNHLTVSVHGGLVEIEKNGLYRFWADGAATVGVIEGKADVSFGTKHSSLGKGHEALLSDAMETRKLDTDREDELLAWSNVRSQYNASLTYQAARTASSAYGSSYNGGYYGGGGGYFGGFYGPGWYWSNSYASWLWMPGDAAFFSPFGWGFYGPGYVMYAPVVVVPISGGGTTTTATGKPVKGPGGGGTKPVPTGTPTAMMTVPVNAKHMPALGAGPSYSLSGFQAARQASARTVQVNGGLHTATGGRPASFSGPSSGGAVRSYSGGGSNGGGSSSTGNHSSGGSSSVHSNGGSSSMGSHSSGGFGGGGGGGAAHSSGGGGSHK